MSRFKLFTLGLLTLGLQLFSNIGLRLWNIASLICPKILSRIFFGYQCGQLIRKQGLALPPLSLHADALDQAIFERAQEFHTWSGLPAHFIFPTFNDANWTIYQARYSSPPGYAFLEWQHLPVWYAFFEGFLDQWAEEDWMPTFDMRLLDTDPSHGGQAIWLGVVREYDPLIDATYVPTNLTYSVLEIDAEDGNL